ncbi:VanZ family protein [Paenibacillus sp. GXUN7292]|uniref:VanZ family protein n=1 Tax=Paenibacillus sp. GXUN7292 TaxID=3422499 RepID=UPI003D7C4C60
MPAYNEYRNNDTTTVKSKGKRIFRFIPALLWMTVIFVLSSRTGDEIDTVLPFFQSFMPWISDFNWGHYIAYFILALTFDFALGKKANRFVWKIAIVLLCGLYGITDEWHQSFVGGRMMDPVDVRNDMIGAAVFVAVIAIPPLQRAWSRLKG